MNRSSSTRTLPASVARAAMSCIGVITLVAACSFSIGGQSMAEAAVDLIEGDYADRFELNLNDTTCDDPPDEEIGTTFTCTSNVGVDVPVEFDVLIDDVDHITVRSTNILHVDAQDRIGQAIADTFAQQGVDGLSGDDLDCGEGPILLGDDAVITCGLTVPDGQVYDTFVRISDLQTLTFDFEVAELPRS